jgi:hypothetical protein
MACEAFVHDAELILDEDVDPAQVGAVVTAELCGSWDHEGPCRWPHNNDVDSKVTTARFRTVFLADAADEREIRARIDFALRDSKGWVVLSARPRELTADERPLAARLARTPVAAQGSVAAPEDEDRSLGSDRT